METWVIFLGRPKRTEITLDYGTGWQNKVCVQAIDGYLLVVWHEQVPLPFQENEDTSMFSTRLQKRWNEEPSFSTFLSKCPNGREKWAFLKLVEDYKTLWSLQLYLKNCISVSYTTLSHSHVLFGYENNPQVKLVFRETGFWPFPGKLL